MSEILKQIDENLNKAKKLFAEQEPAPPAPTPPEGEKKPEEPEEPKPGDEEEMEEGVGIPKRYYEAAKAELKSFTNFLEGYANADDTAFKSAIAEDDAPLVKEAKERPPKAWFENCVESAGKDPDVDDPAALCGWVWTNWATPGAKKKMKKHGIADPEK